MAGEILSQSLVFTFLMVLGALSLFYLVFWLLSKRFFSRLGARKMSEANGEGGVIQILSRLAHRTGVQEPTLYILDETSPNALCFRSRGGVILLTRGLLEVLSREELEAILAHCLAQIQLRRYRFSGFAALLALPLSRLAKRLPLVFGVLFQGLASLVVRSLIAPNRLFDADESAARMIQNPDLLALSLRKLTSLTQKIPMSNPEIAIDHLFVVPSLRGDSFAPTLSTYPPAEERIRRLLAIPLSC
jgi:heat shock protein HtpX